MRKWKIVLTTIMALLLFVSIFPFQSKAAEKVQLINVPFYSAGLGVMDYDFPYSDSYFQDSSEVFSRDLAKASLGLMASAFRKQKTSGLENQYTTYLEAAGFKNIYGFGYDKPTSTETLSGVIASKKIDDYTLVAAAPSGQGYAKEWGGNLKVGTGERHEGFNHGAQIFEEEILNYIEKQGIEGKIKLWVSGFSRASAVCNLAAGDLIETGKFDDVYAYLYGVPRTTKNPKAYQGIFNICGKFDPVPQVPLESWGYQRNGTDLFTPAAEMDANYDEYLAAANDACWQIADDFFRYNPELNYQIHLIMEFLGELLPTSKEYVDKMQGTIMGIWTEANPDQIEQILISVLSQMSELDQRQEYSSEAAISYITYIASQRLKDTTGSTELRDIVWANDQGVAANLLREHMPYIYMSWIFSDLPDKVVFHGPEETRRLSIFGEVDVEVWHGDQFLSGIDRKGNFILPPEPREETAEDYFLNVFMVRNGVETLLFLPYDTDLKVKVRTDQMQDLFYYNSVYQAGKTYATDGITKSVLLEAGEYSFNFTGGKGFPELMSESGKIWRSSELDYGYSPTMVMEIESSSTQHFTLGSLLGYTVAIIAFIVVLLLVCLIIAIVHSIRKKKHGPYSPWYVIVPHLILFVLFVLLTYYFTAKMYMIPITRIVFTALSMLMLVLLSLRGAIRSKKTAPWIITGVIAVIGVVLCLIYQKSNLVSAQLISFIPYCVFLAAVAVLAASTFWIGKKKKTAQTAQQTE